MRIRAFLLLAVLAAVGVVGVASCASPQPARPQVVAVGDSLMLLASPNIERDLAPKHDETIIAKNGRRIDEMLPLLRRALRDRAPVDAVVVNLGTNNVIQGREYPRALEDFGRLLDAVDQVPCVVVTTVSSYLDTTYDTHVASRLNAKIRALSVQDPNRYQVVDWDAAIHAPGGVEELMMVDGVTDGVHENPTTGRQWFADEYVDALSRCPRLNRP